MNTLAMLCLGAGIIFTTLGAFFLYTHYKKGTPPGEYEWVGYGDHPFR